MRRATLLKWEGSLLNPRLISRPRFGLAWLLALVAVLGLAVALATRPLWLARHRDAALAELEATYWASAALDDRTWDDFARRGFVVVRSGDPHAAPGVYRRWLGDHAVNEILLREGMLPSDSEYFSLFPEATFYARAAIVDQAPHDPRKDAP